MSLYQPIHGNLYQARHYTSETSFHTMYLAKHHSIHERHTSISMIATVDWHSRTIILQKTQWNCECFCLSHRSLWKTLPFINTSYSPPWISGHLANHLHTVRPQASMVISHLVCSDPSYILSYIWSAVTCHMLLHTNNRATALSLGMCSTMQSLFCHSVNKMPSKALRVDSMSVSHKMLTSLDHYKLTEAKVHTQEQQ